MGRTLIANAEGPDRESRFPYLEQAMQLRIRLILALVVIALAGSFGYLVGASRGHEAAPLRSVSGMVESVSGGTICLRGSHDCYALPGSVRVSRNTQMTLTLQEVPLDPNEPAHGLVWTVVHLAR